MKIRREDLFTIPNILCYIRIILVPIFVYCYLQANSPKEYFLSSCIALLAALTDVLDGYIARHFHMITDWGKFIDPLADKLMQAAMIFVMLWKMKWMILLCALFVLKELIMFLVGLFLFKKGKHLDGAIWCGKCSTVVLDTVMFIFLAFPGIDESLAQIMIGIAFAFLALSFVVYMNEYLKMYREMKQENK